MENLLESNGLKIWISSRSFQVEKENICYCHAEGCYSRIFLIDGESYLLSQTLKSLEEQLPEEYFSRCHRSYLINIKKILSVDIERHIIHQRLYQIPVSNRKLIDLLSKRDAYLINKK